MPDNLARKRTEQEKRREKSFYRQTRAEKNSNKDAGRKIISFPTDYPAEDWESELASQQAQEREDQEGEEVSPAEIRLPKMPIKSS